MSVRFIQLNRLVSFHEEPVTRTTAMNYVEEMEKAMTPFVVVEQREDNKYNVIGGFKYIAGVRLLNKNTKLYCTVVNSFDSEKQRYLAMLQRCLANYENIKYREILVQELVQRFKMTEKTISHKLGHDATKIKKYMYNQIIPMTYLEKAEQLGIKPLIQAIYLANSFLPHEKRVLTELSLINLFKNKHMVMYKKYRKRYSLFDDFAMAKQQVIGAINTEEATEEYWATMPNPLTYYFDDLDTNEKGATH